MTKGLTMRSWRLIGLAGLVCLLVPFAQAASGPANLDFEDGELGQTPAGWFVPPAFPAAKAELRGIEPRQGKLCVRLSGTEAGDKMSCNLMQSFDAAPYHGQRVRLRAAVRVPSGPATRVQMWLREDRPRERLGFFDNMSERPIAKATWEYYEIIGDISDDGVTLNIGFMLFGGGPAWVDDVTFEALGTIEPQTVAGPLDGRALDNLVAFTRLLGYVRYFHPSDEVVHADWNALATRGVRQVESAATAEQLAQRLRELFQPLAPSLVVLAGTEPAAAAAYHAPARPAGDKVRIVYWRHLGVQPEKRGEFSPYHSSRIDRTVEPGAWPEDMPDPDKPFLADLGGGVACCLPLTLYVDEQGTMPRAVTSSPAPTTSAAAGLPEPTGRARFGRDTRLAAVALAWNVMEHFYPYFDVVQTDWPAVLRTTLTSAATDADERAFLTTLRRMIAQLHDGHGNVWHACDAPYRFQPGICWDWIEGQLVITHVEADVPDADKLRPGALVKTVEGVPAADALARAEELISGATPQWRRYRGLQELLAGERDSELHLTIGGDSAVSVALKRTHDAGEIREPRPEKVAELRPGVMYVDLDRIDDNDFARALPQLEKAQGIVFDVRGYPRSSTAAISHLIDEPVHCARWNVPIVLRPDRVGTQFQFSDWTVQPQAPRFQAKVAFITDGRAISYAETYLGIIEHYKLGAIVGGPTAGTNGNVNPFTVPGGYTITWTGMKVLKHDGSQHHGIGIQPTVPAHRTIAGVQAGRDELLERAIEVVAPAP